MLKIEMYAIFASMWDGKQHKKARDLYQIHEHRLMDQSEWKAAYCDRSVLRVHIAVARLNLG